MRILYVIEGDGGGAVSHVLTLARYLATGAHAVDIAFLMDGPSVQAARQLGLSFRVFAKRLSCDLMPAWKISDWMDKQSIQIIHSHTIRGNFYARMAVAFNAGARRCLTTVHSHIVDELKGATRFGLRENLLWQRERITARYVDHFICVSRALKARLLSNKISGDRITVIENGIPLPDWHLRRRYYRSVRDEFSLADDEIIVAAVGRLVPVKNHWMLLEGAKLALMQDRRIKFLIVGDGPLADSLKEKAKRLGIDRKVVFAGWRNDVKRLLCGIDIYAITSLVEGLNLSVLEAMAWGKPVVGTAVAGIAETVIDTETGLLVRSHDAKAFSDAILTLAHNRRLREDMGLRGRAEIEQKYGVKTMVKKTEQVYERIWTGHSRQ